MFRPQIDEHRNLKCKSLYITMWLQKCSSNEKVSSVAAAFARNNRLLTTAMSSWHVDEAFQRSHPLSLKTAFIVNLISIQGMIRIKSIWLQFVDITSKQKMDLKAADWYTCHVTCLAVAELSISLIAIAISAILQVVTMPNSMIKSCLTSSSHHQTRLSHETLDSHLLSS